MRAGILTRRRVQLQAVSDACQRHEPVLIVQRTGKPSVATGGMLQAFSSSGLEITLDGETTVGAGPVDIYFRDEDGLEYVMTSALAADTRQAAGGTLHLEPPLRIDRPRRRRLQRQPYPAAAGPLLRITPVGKAGIAVEARLTELSLMGLQVSFAPGATPPASLGDCCTIELLSSGEAQAAVSACCIHSTPSPNGGIVAGFEFCGGDDPSTVPPRIDEFERSVRDCARRLSDGAKTHMEGGACS